MAETRYEATTASLLRKGPLLQRQRYRQELPRPSNTVGLRLLIGTVACYQRSRRAAGNAAGSVRKGEASPATRERSKARRGWSRSQGVDQERSAVRRPQGARCKSLPPLPRSTSPNHINRDRLGDLPTPASRSIAIRESGGGSHKGLLHGNWGTRRYAGPMAAPTTINPDDFLETPEGRVWTVERNEEAWRLSYAALERVLELASASMRVVVVCGIQGAGKSTWIALQPVSPSTIYFDAALPGVRHRARVISIAQRLGSSVEAVWIDTPLDVAIERNAARSPDKVVPTPAIIAVAQQFEKPTAAEGFDHVAIFDGG